MKILLDRFGLPDHRLVRIVIGVSLTGLGINLKAQTTYTYSGTAADKNWLTTTNWTGNTGHYPGVPTTTSSTAGASSDIADFGSAVTSSTNNVGISFATTGGGLTLGTIDAISGLSKNVTIGDSSSGTAGVLTLTGNTLYGLANTIASNESSSNVTLQGGTSLSMSVALGSSSNVVQVNGSGNITISSNITDGSSASALNIAGTGSGSVTLSGTNTFSGGLVITGGQVDVAADGNLGVSGGSVTINGGRLELTASTTIGATRNILLGANPSGSNAGSNLDINGSGTTVIYNGVLQDLSGATGDFVKQGGGTLQLGGVSKYSGNTFVNNGTIQLTTSGTGSSTTNGQLPSTTVLSIGQSSSTNTGNFDLNGINQTIAGLTSISGSATTTTNTVTSSTGNATLTLNESGATPYSYGSGATSNTGLLTDSTAGGMGGRGVLAVIETGNGTQILGGANTYTGGTQIVGGSLLVTNSSGSATGTGAVTVNNSGSLLGGTGTISGAVSVSNLGNGGTISAGMTGQTTKTTLTTGALTLGTNSIFNAIIAGNNAYGTLAASGITNVTNAHFTITVPSGTTLSSGETLTLITSSVSGQFINTSYTADGYDFTASYSNGEFSVETSSVPEPATVVGGLLMVTALGYSQRRRAREWVAVARALRSGLAA